MSNIQITEVALANCNLQAIIINKNSRVLHAFIPNKSFDQLLDISPKDFIFLRTFKSELSYIEVWFTDQHSKPLETEDKINMTLAIN